MDTDETALRRACYAAPADAAPWGAFADWLRDHGRDREADGLAHVRAAILRLRHLAALPVAARLPDE